MPGAPSSVLAPTLFHFSQKWNSAGSASGDPSRSPLIGSLDGLAVFAAAAGGLVELR